MKGRTNISGGGMNINANVENFQVAEGSNVVAGNFVQYKMASDDRKYDTNVGYGSDYANSNNEAPKVLPCGNNRYVRRYKNNSEENITWFNLIDVSNGFKVLSTFSIASDNLPAFCLLSDGNIAVCYMTSTTTIEVRIYNIVDSFAQLNNYDFTTEIAGNSKLSHITQIGNSKIIVNNENHFFICNYSSGEITGNQYTQLEELATARSIYDNDWNTYAVGEDKFILFRTFYSYDRVDKGYLMNDYYCSLIKVLEDGSALETLDNILLDSSGSVGMSLNTFLWGNAFGINGKVLFSEGNGGNGSYKSAHETKIYYVQNDKILQTSTLNPLIELESEGIFLPSNVVFSDARGSATAQYAKEDVIYISVCAHIERSGGQGENDACKTAIYRMEYSTKMGEFTRSNIVTFEGEEDSGVYTYKFGFGQFFESDSGDVYYLYETTSSSGYEKQGRWLMKLSYKDGILTMGNSTGMVENYDGSGAAIGVAKQSGKPGDIIEVYTPKA